MLIWGTRAVRKQLHSGAFYCPTCRSEQPYRLMRAQKHGHVYWIPLFSTGQPVEYVECQGCQGTFDPRVLDVAAPADPATLFALFQWGMLQVMVSIMLADGEASDSERSTIANIYEQVAGTPLDRSDLDTVVADVSRSEESLIETLSELEPRLNNTGKERIVQSALLVALADGDFDHAESDQVIRIARSLGLTDAHLKGLAQSLQA